MLPVSLRLAILLGCLALFVGPLSSPTFAEPSSARQSTSAKADKQAKNAAKAAARERKAEAQLGASLADTARSHLGSPYRWGGSSPASGFDCSGFVMYVYSTIGIGLPRDLGAQLQSGPAVEPGELRPGDLVFFRDTYRRGLSHAGVYVGDDQFVHAVDEAHGVTLSTIGSAYWASRFVGASRPRR